MTTPYLPDDCIYYILKYLQNSHSTLFNCLLVNRFWCKAAVPLLYSDPFNYLLSNEKIIPTLILCFNKTEILQLKNELELINIDKNIITNDEYKPLFEYPKYLENLDCNEIESTIYRWINLSFPYRSRKLYENFIPTFYNSILCRTISIKQLNISPNSSRNLNVQPNLTKLISLKLDLIYFNAKNDKIELEIVSNILNNCLNLRKLKITELPINNDPINKQLCTIIQKQNNLKAFKLSCSSILNTSIFSSLEFQKHSLIYIEFHCVTFSDFSFENFINLCNLKYLIFSGNGTSKTISLGQCETLKYASFKLKRLEFKCRWNNSLIISLIIKYLGTSLQELYLYNEPNISVIENISTYCSDLIKLEIYIESSDICFLSTAFKNLKIRILSLIDCYDWSDYSSRVAKTIASNLPTNVKEVSLHFFDFSCFKEFLESCHCCLEGINFNFEHYIKTIDVLKLTLNYIERSNNSLKFLGMKFFYNPSDEHLELLDQIKAKGVKVVEYSFRNSNDFNDFIV